ncbi:unnamed protein product [Acanthoscelides obtectus]|uniref:Tc1-like transposase DDE domain-containing protein n=1 Tax=Acanthoscelides obtectus TaxID=200917 RepID=A0A9P0L5Q3_ACAOB|nr:unnamed protein product [Acanthoscelides obtectus]CAK1651642.1 Transposable element Tc3 transposase [Acanthoscelides obtectus]
MVATFVSKSGHIATIPLNEQRTVTANWYTTICLPKIITELRKINPERRIILYQDNASLHIAQKTRQYLTEENVELLDHSPYSPDLSPNDFFTFPKIKNRLRRQRFQSPEEAVDAFKNTVLDLPANEWNKCFDNWFKRMQMCINFQGLYPFHVQRVQALRPDDVPARVRFCEWLLHQHDNNPDFLKCILVTDESTFTRNGMNNFRNTHVWSVENPHAVRRAHFQQTFSVNVWAGMVNGMLIGPFIVPNRLDGMQYLDFLPNILPSLFACWCRQRSLWDQEWNSIVFSDEFRFCLGMHDGRAGVRRRRGERRNPQFFVERHVHHTVGVIVWDAIAYGSRSPLIFIRGNMNAQRYIHGVLELHLLPYLDTLADPTFQQDNARPHVARVTIDFFQHNDVTLLPWPPRSPDLSPIEHLNLQRPPQTLGALREELVVAWNEIPQEDIDHLIRSMPRRVGECVAHQGASTHY